MIGWGVYWSCGDACVCDARGGELIDEGRCRGRCSLSLSLPNTNTNTNTTLRGIEGFGLDPKPLTHSLNHRLAKPHIPLDSLALSPMDLVRSLLKEQCASCQNEVRGVASIQASDP